MALPPDALEKVRGFITGRKRAYCRTLNLQSVDVQVVLQDLAKFCRAHDSTAHADPHVAARLDGRREVWLRVQQHLQISDETLWLLYGGPQLAKGN